MSISARNGVRAAIPKLGRMAVFVMWGAVAAGLAGPAQGQTAQKKQPMTLRAVLLAELKSTHNSEEWFVPVDVAVGGLTPEQAAWRDAKGNHSVGQLVYHLWYWDLRALQGLKGEKLLKYSGNNDDTFNNYDPKKWKETVQQLDEALSGLEQWVQTAPETKLAENAQLFTHISTHNAYHIGEMVYVRKEQGSWNPAVGVH
jgi:uncharacterized damage-inducible protein DinB